ncbi:MAG TPA: hypothetical protein VIK35_09595 [Verrucomicrobiae bacterium]
MSSVQEIEAAISQLSRAEIEEVRARIDDFLEDQLELTDDVKAKLDQPRREHQQKTFDITPELEAWLLEAADKPTTPLTKSDFAAIHERVRAKTSAA